MALKRICIINHDLDIRISAWTTIGAILENKCQHDFITWTGTSASDDIWELGDSGRKFLEGVLSDFHLEHKSYEVFLCLLEEEEGLLMLHL